MFRGPQQKSFYQISVAANAVAGITHGAFVPVRLQQNHEGQEGHCVVAQVGGEVSEEKVCQLQEPG